MDLADDLIALAVAALREGHRAAVVVRHAERGPVIDLTRHHEVLLTPRGHERAEEGGRRLGDAVRTFGVPVVVGHSPIPRCAQTAQAIARGLVAQGAVVVSRGADDGLGASYLRDPPRVARGYLTHGKRFVRDWFDGVIGDDVIAPHDEVAAAVVAAARGLLAEHSFAVAVTHDWNIAAVRESALASRFEDAGWPAFLDGVVIVAEGATTRVRSPARSWAAERAGPDRAEV